MHVLLLPDHHSLPVLHQLRDAINALYCGVDSIQRPADAWLQNFRSSPGSWRLCVQLLDAPHLQEHECYFAANNIKVSCQKHQDVLVAGTLRDLLTKLALHTRACLHKQQWASASQLAAAAASAAARAPSLPPNSIVQELLSLFLPAPAVAAVAAAAAATSAAAAATVAAHSGGDTAALVSVDSTGAAAVAAAAAAASNMSSQTVTLHLQQDPAGVAAVLQLLAALPEAALSKQTSVHPDRRTALTDSLQESTWPAPVLRAALCSQNTKLTLLACEAITSWCELGVPPPGLETHTDALDVLAAALLGRETAIKACEAFSAMLIACKESSSGGSTFSGSSSVLLVQLLQQLQGNVLPALAAEHRSMGLGTPAVAAVGSSTEAAAAAGGPASADVAAYSAVVRSHINIDAEAAFCRVLCAAAAAMLRPVMAGAVALQSLLEVLLQQLLLSIGVSEDAVAMTALDFWQDSYLAVLEALPQEQQTAVLAHQRGVLEALTAALVQRTQLGPAAAAAATADARDLPEEMRMVRRELASALRDIGGLLGPPAMLSFVTQLTSKHYQHLCATHQAANPLCNRACVPGLKVNIGLQGVAAGLAAGTASWGGAAVNNSSAAAAATSAAPCAVINPGDWLPLESALYAANVVLGKQKGEGDVLQVQQLVQYAAAAIVHPGGSLKLSGTALTLLGGLAAWLAVHAESLPAVLHAICHALRSSDDKLARNAATCTQRLAGCEELAVLLTRQHADFVQQLLQAYQGRGGLASRAAAPQGDDKPTGELLLLSLCSLAVAHTGNSSADMDSVLVQLVGPQLTAATDELVAAVHGIWPLQQQQQQQLPSMHQHQHILHQAATAPLQRTRQQQQQQQVVMVGIAHSTAVNFFKALASLVAGLPTGVMKQSLGVAMHFKHPRHQQQLLQRQQQQQLMASSGGGVQQQHLFAAAGVRSSSSAGEDDASMCSTSERSDSSGSGRQYLHGAAASTSTGQLAACQGRCSHPYCHHQQQQQMQQQQQQNNQAEAAALLRQQQACFIASQLLQKALQPVMLAIRAAATAAQHQYAQELLGSVCSFLLAALPAAVRLQQISTSQQQIAMASDTATAAHSSSGSSSIGGPSSSGSSNNSNAATMQTGTLLLQLCQLLEQLPASLLQQPCCLQLLCNCLATAAAAGALVAAGSQQPQVQQQQLLDILQKLISQCLVAACSSIMLQAGGADPDTTSAALALASVSLQQCPAVLAGADVDALLAMTLTATKTYHLTQCTAVLDWIQVLAQAVCTQQQQQQPSMAAADSTDADTLVVSAIHQRLEGGGLGPHLVLALLLAASGAMPPDMVLPISFCLHSMWLSVGRQFEGWLQAAVMQLAPEDAPWQRQRHGAKVTFIADLTDQACLTDTTRFKRILKNFCGGKKKGAGGGRHL